MLRVLVADDEQKVCQLIANIVDWKALGFEIVGVVNDGLSAYRFLQEHMVDLMLTDIRMPGYDGMELIQKAQVINPNMNFIIISGYSQFDYAQQAIRYGVEDYLLKPIRKKDLVATLMKVLDKYQEEVQDTQKRENFEKLLKKNEARIKQSLLEDILKRPEKFGGFFLREKINEGYHYHFEDDCYRTVIVKVLPGKRREDIETRRLLLKKGVEVLEEFTGGICRETVLNIVDGRIYGIYNGSREQIEQLSRKLKRTRLELMHLKDIFQDIQVYIAVGKAIDNFQNILESFKDAETAMKGRFYGGQDALLTVKGVDTDRNIIEEIIDNSFKKRFLNCIEIMDFNDIAMEMKRVKDILTGSRNKDGNDVTAAYKEVLSVFYFGTHCYNITIPDQHNELLMQLELYGTIEEAFAHLENYMITSLKHWMAEKKYVESKPIRAAKQYIAVNYHRPLTLEIVSREVGFNPTYFSGIFKKETNMNFLEYLKEVRIENAKTLLLTTEQSVEEISGVIGYSDIKHFSRLFKKLTGVTPTEFRKLYN